MNRHKSSFVLLISDKSCIGILTLRSIVESLTENDKYFYANASEFMTAPVIYINENTSIAEAAVIMHQKNESHLVVNNSKGELTGVIDKEGLYEVFLRSPDGIHAAVKHFSDIPGLVRTRQKVPYIIKPVLKVTGSANISNNIISEFNDEITIRIIDDVIKEIGEPPVSFAFISIGSAGRKELSFNSDQDNAVIFEESDDISSEDLQNYFLNLGEKVCKRLDETGLPLCQGGYMASNKEWCQPLNKWKAYFNEWIENAEPENILNISVFFDFRLIYGKQSLFNELEDHVFNVLQGRSAFFYFLARSASRFKPPVNVFGNIVTETSSDNEEVINIKNYIAQIVMFVRIYALHNNIRSMETVERIKSLMSLGILNYATSEEVLFHYNYLMHLLLKNQIEQINSGSKVTNSISIKKLTEMEQTILKKVFTQMNAYQEKLSATFMSSYKEL